ncbi:UDP-2-acetamido-2-deoxy-3-oxo-D-glucuronate aminotransferase [Methyloligella halotolerans]|uniref:UDP-2-acetamido-2-deoxy-3-oxo-D-glucuronate aminotransferase n=2 Tax=Methyloligella halotolerans TaxID=1177755 RepID=A0A1E2S2S2_9HYPH|nr:UDP-2-acetamido-2-deoxy-3-oxo-D-glucuronate aminotransferase [Methyloligella halotolerans]
MTMTDVNARERTESVAKPLAFIDLAAQQERIRPQVEQAVLRVLDHGKYIMGPEITQLEEDLARFCGAKHSIACGSGTDALLMLLMAKGIGPGDAVICPSFTFTATAEMVALLGASPVFIDIEEESFNLDPAQLPAAVEAAKAAGLTPKGIIAVDLFGLPADYDAIEAFAEENGLWVLDDAAQGFGGTYKGRKVGTFGYGTATSFFPAKPLGGYGDSGAIFTDDEALVETLHSIRNHGASTKSFDNPIVGLNGRMDSMQAGILIEKLKIFPDEIEARDRIAATYNAGFEGLSDVVTPVVPDGLQSVWAQYTLKIKSGLRDSLVAALKDMNVPTAIHYLKGIHLRTTYADYPRTGGALPVTDRLCGEVVSLPMHPYLSDEDQARIIDAVRSAMASL